MYQAAAGVQQLHTASTPGPRCPAATHSTRRSAHLSHAARRRGLEHEAVGARILDALLAGVQLGQPLAERILIHGGRRDRGLEGAGCSGRALERQAAAGGGKVRMGTARRRAVSEPF